MPPCSRTTPRPRRLVHSDHRSQAHDVSAQGQAEHLGGDETSARGCFGGIRHELGQGGNKLVSEDAAHAFRGVLVGGGGGSG
jgi:hypothetical protein